MENNAANLLRIMGDHSRFRIISYLLNKPRNVSEIVRKLGLKQSLVSHHLKVMKQYGILECVREGPFVRYFVNKPQIAEIISQAIDSISKETSKKKGK
ncbi:MAG: helix-turn-helix transcriptional regulator [FCB group bacterium]|nr:helix-turn-helix transcriptional regulator [FCB group bacterium]